MSTMSDFDSSAETEPSEVADSASLPSEASDTAVPVSRRRWHSVVLVLLVAVLVGYMIVLPLAQQWLDSLQQQKTISMIEEMTLAESIQLRVMQGATGLWFLALGGTIGSFLNVVAYRLPLGQSVVFKPSSCPGCGNRISARDNVPVIGWLALGGRCRNCGMAISPRYPVVEALVAIVFFLFFVFQLITGSANIPGREPPSYTGIVWIIFYTKWDHILLYVYHCLLASALFAWALIDFDSQRIRWSASAIVAGLLVVPILLWPELHSVPIDSSGRFLTSPSIVQSVIVGVVGGLVGAVIGAITGWSLGDRGHAAGCLAWVGMAMGWQASMAVLIVTLVLRLLAWLPTRFLGLRPLPLTHFILLAFVIHHIHWRWTIDHLSPYWPGHKANFVGWTTLIAVLLGLLFVQSIAVRAQRTQARPLTEV